MKPRKIGDAFQRSVAEFPGIVERIATTVR